MFTVLFLLVLGVLATLGHLFWRQRLQAYQEAVAEREQAQADALVALQRAVKKQNSERASSATSASASPVVEADLSIALPSPPVPAVVTAARVTPPVPTPVDVMPAPASMPPATAAITTTATDPAADANTNTAPTALDIASLRALRSSRFARVCLAYFESTGMSVRKYTGEEPIDALLFLGRAQTPTMALRFARSAEHPAGSREIIEFGKACVKRNIQHATFLAQHGATLNATKAAVEQSIALVTAEQLALKIASMPDDRRRAVVSAARD